VQLALRLQEYWTRRYRRYRQNRDQQRDQQHVLTQHQDHSRQQEDPEQRRDLHQAVRKMTVQAPLAQELVLERLAVALAQAMIERRLAGRLELVPRLV
jgi:hypothetical protein